MLENKSENYLKNALTLAFLGDAVFTLKIREELVKSCNDKPNSLNTRANKIVCARNQAEIMHILRERLRSDELDIVMRARNSHLTNRKAKNSTIEEYNLATQFEALIGYWYLNGENDKINDVLSEFVWSKL